MPWDKLDWTAVGAGILFLLSIMFQSLRGYFGGKERGPQSPPPSVEVAGALIDTKTVGLLTDAIGQNTYHTTDLKKSVEALRVSVERNTDGSRDAVRDAVDQMERLARDMRELGDRIARSGK